MQFNKNETNPILCGYMELIGDANKKMQELQKQLDEEMKDNEVVKAAMIENQKEMMELQQKHQKKMKDIVQADAVLSKLVKELEGESQSRTEYQDMFEQEMFKATYMSPIMLDPKPVKGQKPDPGCKINFPALPLQNGKKVLMVFTDRAEMDKWSHDDSITSISVKLQDMFGMVTSQEDLVGVVINPFGANIIIPQEKFTPLVNKVAGKKA